MPVLSPATAPTLDEVKARLRITTAQQDDTVQAFLDGAVAEYEERVGPTSPVSHAATLQAGTTLLLPHAPVVSVESVTDGSPLTLTDLHVDLAAGLIRWPHGTSYRFRAGVTVVYTAGGMPANHREALLLDVEGLYRASQRGSSGNGARSSLIGGDDIYERATYASPMTLYPRIRALAGPSLVA